MWETIQSIDLDNQNEDLFLFIDDNEADHSGSDEKESKQLNWLWPIMMIVMKIMMIIAMTMFMRMTLTTVAPVRRKPSNCTGFGSFLPARGPSSYCFSPRLRMRIFSRVVLMVMSLINDHDSNDKDHIESALPSRDCSLSRLSTTF